jgi:hypothetical protein
MPEWKNEHGEKLVLDWDEQGRGVLRHSDAEDRPYFIDVHVVGYDTDKPWPLADGHITSEGLQRHARGDIVLSAEEQTWLISEWIKEGLRRNG